MFVKGTRPTEGEPFHPAKVEQSLRRRAIAISQKLPSESLTSDKERVHFLARLCWGVLDGRGRAMLIGSVGLVAALSFGTSAVPILFAKFVDSLTSTPTVGATATTILAAFLLVYWLSNIGREALWIVVGPIQQRIQRKASVRILRHTVYLPYQYHALKSTGEFTEKLQQAQNGLGQIIFATLTSLMPILLQTVFVVVNSLIFLPAFVVVIMSVTVAVYLVVLFRGAERIRQHQRKAQGFLIRARGHLTDVLGNVETVKAFVREETTTSHYDQLLLQSERQFRKFLFARFLLGAAQSTIMIVSLATALTVGLVNVQQSFLTIGALVLIEMYFIQLIEPLQGLSRHYRETKTALTMFDGVAEVLSYEPEPHAQAGDQGKVAKPESHDPGASSADANGRIVFNNVTVIRDDRAIVDDVSMSIESGASVAFVGRTGSGKSSIVRLLLKLLEPTSGTISVGGVSLADIPSAQWRGGVSLVPQEVILFNDTLASNLRFADPLASDEDLRMVLKRVRLTELLDKSGNGLELLVGERGQIMSGGERQRIGLARALLRHAKIFIFDEATSGLDLTTEAEILAELSELDSVATKIVVTHRIRNVTDFDTIFVVEAGRIIRSGTHVELLETSDLYRTFWRETIAETANKTTGTRPETTQGGQ